jgi:outer membrane protein OmpA-like peptidoglycan-associated protein
MSPARLAFSHRWARSTGALLGGLLLTACVATAPTQPTSSTAPPQPTAQPPATVAASAPAAAPAGPPPILPLEQALAGAAAAVFNNAALAGERLPLVIDPLIDGSTWVQSVATRQMEDAVLKTVKERFPRFEPLPFSTTSLARGPYVFIGTFTPLDKEGKNLGATDWYRICLALLDIRSGKIVSKGFARAAAAGVDHTPLPFFQDSPGWSKDSASTGYVSTCQGTKAGDPINPAYWDRIAAAAVINDAINAYQDNRIADALDLYRAALQMPGGKQLRVYNGIYLAQSRLNRRKEAADAFGELLDYGLEQQQVGVKFLFQPGSTQFVNNPALRNEYTMWLQQIGQRASKSPACLQIGGHTSRSGAEPLNERISLQRAVQVRQRLLTQNSRLDKRIKTTGFGSSRAIVGSGTDDARDAVDRRVDFRVMDCAA